jgi:GGDEF domain-containing protein
VPLGEIRAMLDADPDRFAAALIEVERRHLTVINEMIARPRAGRQGAAAMDNALLFREVADLATRDGLTAALNRRHFFEMAEHRVNDWRRYQRPPSQ